MKVLLLLVGLFVIFVVLVITYYSMRLDKPVNATLSNNYYHHRWKNKIIYSPMGNWFELGYTELDADPETFVVVSPEFAKDRNSVYWKDKKQNADVATFYIDENRIPKDMLHAYYLSNNWPDIMTVVSGANPTDYRPYMLKEETYNTGWFRDDHAYYLHGKQVEVDFKTFQRLNSVLAIDTNHVYIIRSANDNLSSLIAKQKNPGGKAIRVTDVYAQVGSHIFISKWDIELLDLDFGVINTLYALDDLNIIVDGKLITRGKLLKDVDVTTLEILPQNYLRDKQHVFYNGNIILNAEPSSFEIVHEDYSKDRNYVFYQTRILPEADPQKFKMNFAEGTGSDGTNTYKAGELVK